MPARMRGWGQYRARILLSVVAVVSVNWAVVSFLFIFTFVIRLQAHPNGGTGQARTWKPEWTVFFNECFASYGESLAQAQPRDKKTYCSNANPDLSENDYWLSLYIPIARAESGFNAHAAGRNGRKTPLGLFQMSADDMARYRCEGRNPRDARQAICCAIKIGSYWAERGEQRISDGKQGILATFFQPIRTGVGGDGRGGRVNDSRKHSSIVASANRLCQYAPASGRREIDATGGWLSCTDPLNMSVVPEKT
jgi:hypothetical protein